MINSLRSSNMIVLVVLIVRVASQGKDPLIIAPLEDHLNSSIWIWRVSLWILVYNNKKEKINKINKDQSKTRRTNRWMSQEDIVIN